MIEDAELLCRYAESRSEDAFAELVHRRIGLVYSVALRKTRDAHRAEDVAQAVFISNTRFGEPCTNELIGCWGDTGLDVVAILVTACGRNNTDAHNHTQTIAGSSQETFENQTDP